MHTYKIERHHLYGGYVVKQVADAQSPHLKYDKIVSRRYSKPEGAQRIMEQILAHEDRMQALYDAAQTARQQTQTGSPS